MTTLLQINTVVNSGSTGRIAEEIGQNAIGQGWESYIAYGRNPQPSRSKLIKIGADCSHNYHGLQTRLFDRHGLASIKSTKEFIRKIESVRPDIIHLHNLHGYYLNIGILFEYLEGLSIPIIWTLHDCWPFTGHCSHFDYIGCEKWKQQCFKCPQKNEYPASYGLDRSKSNFRLKKKIFTSLKDLTIVSVSDWMANLVRQSFLKDIPIRVINNGINLNEFQPTKTNIIREKYGIFDKCLILGVASTWTLRKGLEEFFALSRMLGSDYQIILVGLRKGQIEKLPKNIIGLTRTENLRELVELYTSANVYINLTLEDNFPTTNLEAMACGTPVITYDSGGSVESIVPETGIVVERGNLEGIVKAIHAILKTDKKSYSAFCRDHVLNFYDKIDRNNDYLNLYYSLLKRK